MDLLDSFNKQNIPSVVKDPFNKKNITDIIIRYTTTWGQPHWYATIYFTNGNTKGEQQTPDCKTFDELLIKIKEIGDSIK